MTELLQHLVNGVSVGAIYALIALGYTMVYGVLKLINFAHGDVFMMGAMMGWYASALWSTEAKNPSIGGALLVTLLSMAICGVLGLVNAFGMTKIGIPSFIMTLAMMQIAAGICALLVRGQILYAVPNVVTSMGAESIGGVPWIPSQTLPYETG